MPSRFAAIRTERPVPTHLLIVAGFVCPIVPWVFLPVLGPLLSTPGEGTPHLALVIATIGWLPGLAVLPFALTVAHLLNQRGLNGWHLALIPGAVFGAVSGRIWNGFRMDGFLVASAATGTIYGSFLWALGHGTATFVAWRAG